MLRAAVFDNPVFDGREQEFWAHRPPTAATVVTGVLAEVTPRAIVIARSDGEQFLALSPSTVTWLGAKVSPSALRAGDPVIVRRRTHRLASGGGAAADGGRAARSPSASVAERIWARIGRVAGEILEVRGRELLVETGQHGREPERVVIAEASLRHVQVRFPRLTPGYLIDVIGTRRSDGYLLAVTPATAQPPYLAAHPPAPAADRRVQRRSDQRGGGLARAGRRARRSARGRLRRPRPGDRGRQAGPGDAGHQHEPCARLPYLSLGSAVRVRNECADRAAVLPVTSCSASARQFCDRCVKCGTSPGGGWRT